MTSKRMDSKKNDVEHERNIKLGLVMMQLGIGTEQEIFPNGVPASMPTLTSLSDKNIVAPSPQTRHWYNPLSWFRGSGTQQKTSRIDGQRQHHHHSLVSDEEASQVTGSMPHAPTPQLLDAANRVAEQMVPDTPTPHASHPPTPAIVKQAMMQRNNVPPPIHYNALSDSEVLRLQPSTQSDRSKLLGMEERVHSMLESIEQTKQRYLVPAQTMHCESEVDAVVQCYDRANRQLRASADAKVPLTIRGQYILACSDAVQRLTTCTDNVVHKYAE